MRNRFVLFGLLLISLAACSHHDNTPAPPAPPTNPTTPGDTTTATTAGTDSAYWQIVSNANSIGFNDIWFTDTLHGFAASVDGSIYTSADGGSNWAKSVQLDYAGGGSAGPGLQTLFFANTQIGYAIGTSHIAVTANGGQSWTIKTRPDVPTTGPTSWPNMQFVTPTTGFLSTGQALWRTDDSASHWIKAESDSVGSFYFFGANSGVSFAFPNKINRTSDGVNWQTTATLTNSSANPALTYLQFSDSQNGWFTDIRRLSTTVNGGLGWKAVFQAVSTDAILDFHLLSGNTVYLATNRQLFKTMDGGASWLREYTLSQNLVTQGGLTAVYFTDDHHGWATGGNGVVLRYRH
jgi:photosystem II stability/assembly factor-like uncharacterized protein